MERRHNTKTVIIPGTISYMISRQIQNNSPARYCVLVSRGVWKSVLSWKRRIITIIIAQCRCFCSEKWSSNSILCSEQLHIFHNPDLPSYLLHYSSRTLNTHSLAMSWEANMRFLGLSRETRASSGNLLGVKSC